MHTRAITKEQALAAFDNNAAALARALRITQQAVQQWPEGEPIPRLRQFELRGLLPERFGEHGEVSAAPAAAEQGAT